MIVSTKLHIPPVRTPLVSRPRLMRKLNEGMKAKLTIVSASAGYGKTTALSEWVQQCSLLVAWVSLDKQDNDWIQFWSCVEASIRQRVSDFGLNGGAFLENGSAVPEESAIKALLNELDQLTSGLVIILDDYHVIELTTIHHSLQFLLEHLPPQIHLYIASRSDLEIPTARLLATGELYRIKMEDLRFQLKEGIAFFRETTELLLTKKQATELIHQTEGWISGMKLAAISLRSSDNIDESIDQFSGQQQHISDYLLEEVLLDQSEDMRAFLMETSILSRMNHSLCKAVTGQMNCQEQLERLERLNLFIVPLDDHRNWYRYHQLLSDFLQQSLFRAGPDKWAQAHIQAAHWLENHGFEEEAIEHYLEGKQIVDAVRLIEKHFPVIIQSKTDTLRRWVALMPEDALADNPLIELFYISVLIAAEEQHEAFRRVVQAEARFLALQEKMTEAEWKQTMGTFYLFGAATSYLQKDLVRTSAYFELTERLLPEGSTFQTMGRNRYGYDAFDDLLAWINDLQSADAFLLKWIKAWEDKQKYPLIGYFYASYSELLYEWDRLEEAEFYANRGLGRADIKPFARIFMCIAINASRIQQARGNHNRASEILRQLKLQIDSPDYELMMLNIEVEQAYLSLQQGSTQQALSWLQHCGLAYTDEVTVNHMAEYVVLARVLVACDQMEEALNLLERMYDLASKEDRLRDRIKILIQQSLTLQLMGQLESALTRLETALHLAEPEGYIRSFIDAGPMMVRLLSTYLNVQHGKHLRTTLLVSLSYVEKLLQAFQVTSEEELSIKNKLTEQELKVLRLIASGMSNKQIVPVLNVSGDTVKFHIKNVYRKLGVNSRVQALQRVIDLRILD